MGLSVLALSFGIKSSISTYPLVFVLLPDRQMTTYRRLFRLLKNHVQEKLHQEFAPARMQTDLPPSKLFTPSFPMLRSRAVSSITVKPYGGRHKTLDWLCSTRKILKSNKGSGEVMAGGYGCNSCSSTRRGL